MAWYNTSWSYRVKVTVDDTKVNADLTDFPVYVDLNDLPAGFFSHVRSDGGDIRVTTSDEVTEVPRQVVSISVGSSTGELHFKAPSLANATDTDFYIYYGNAGATEPAANATYGSENVWTNGYLGVYHMNEDPSGGAPQLINSAASSVDGTVAGTWASTDLDPAKLGNGWTFGGTNQNVSFGDNFDYTAAFTAQCWASTPNINKFLFRKVDNWQLIVRGGGHINFETTNAAAGEYMTTPDGTVVSGSGTLRMYHAVLNTATPRAELFINGASDAVDTTASGSASSGNANTCYISSTSDFFDGLMDEVRISNVARASTWISTEYNNQNDPGTFYAVSAEEANVVGGAPVPTLLSMGVG